MRVLLVSANREQLPSAVVPLGILYVAAAIRPEHDVELVDLCFVDDPVATVAEVARRFAPDVVGLGLRNLHDNTYGSSDELLAYYEAVARSLRTSMPKAARLVLGGPALTLRPNELLARLGADHGVVGEGERAFAALLAALEAGQEPPRIVHAAAVRPEPNPPSSLVRATASRPPTEGLDALRPPARDLIDPRYFEADGTDTVQTKRGCAFACSYCDYPDLEGRKVRLRDPVAVADEMVARSQVAGVTHLFIVDSVFNVPRSHALAICEALIARGAPIPWVCYVSPASLDDDVIGAMARAGCVGAEVGTDTGTERMSARLNKPFSLDQVRQVRASFKRHGIADCHTFVVGAEDETLEEARATVRFVDEIDPDIAVFVIFMEDREDRIIGRAKHRAELLAMLREEALRRPGWIVPELEIRFGAKLSKIARRLRFRGPGWVRLAHERSKTRHLERRPP